MGLKLRRLTKQITWVKNRNAHSSRIQYWLSVLLLYLCSKRPRNPKYFWGKVFWNSCTLLKQIIVSEVKSSTANLQITWDFPLAFNIDVLSEWTQCMKRKDSNEVTLIHFWYLRDSDRRTNDMVFNWQQLCSDV